MVVSIISPPGTIAVVPIIMVINDATGIIVPMNDHSRAWHQNCRGAYRCWFANRRAYYDGRTRRRTIYRRAVHWRLRINRSTIYRSRSITGITGHGWLADDDIRVRQSNGYIKSDAGVGGCGADCYR
jgi:hypothetical protein